MSRIDYYKEHLAEHLDAHGDLSPPWEAFPDYERYSLGWRMGSGESWLDFFRIFLSQLPTDFDTRLAYLQRHAKAPYSWSDWVHVVLYPTTSDDSDEEDDEEDEDDDDDGERERQRRREERQKFVEMGLVASDIAYFTWRAKQESIEWPWKNVETPREAARYWTRDIWFWGRHMAELRAQNNLPQCDAPAEWQEIAEIVRTGKSDPVAPHEGLLSLARCMAAGNVIAPWQIGLVPADFKDSFEKDMGYVDAFRLWGMSVFDDQPMIDRYTESTQMPATWKEWMTEHFSLD